MRIAVYTLTRDRLHLARPCFERLWERAGAPFDHFVLDNGSVDGTPRWLEEHAARFARVVTSPTNLGIARGCNRLLDLIAEAGPYDLAIKLDDDCGLVTPDLLTRLAAALAADPLWRARRALSPRVLGLLHQPPRARYERLGPHRVGVTGHVGGIFLPVPWDLLRGYRFPDDLPLGAGADGHLCRWLVERGVTVGYLEDLEVRHHLTTVGQWNLERRYFSRKATERGRREVDPPRPDLDVRELAPTAGPRLPVTVVVPLSAGRRAFFEARGLPSLLAAGPERVVVVSGEAGACRKRNAGFARVRTPYVFFCDDDVELAPDALARLLRALEAQPAAGYAYCSYEGLVTPPATHPLGERFTHVARPFDAAALRRRNLASTMSLLRANLVPGFDEGLRRLQDWDLWLTLLDRGVEGVAVPEVLFTAHYLDQGITASVDGDEARAAVAARHDLDVGSAEVAWRQHVRALADLVSAPHLRRLATVGLAPLLREVVTAHAPREAQVVHELIDGPPVDVLVLGDGASVGGEALADRLAPRAAVVLEGGAAGGLHEWEARLRARGYELVADAFPTGPGLARIQLLGEQPPDP
ncbi:MAG: glycosyltransferase, partial [Planctomycetota bacterium]|nr:glycosyltransferase [Planctomycetota bacterium]